MRCMECNPGKNFPEQMPTTLRFFVHEDGREFSVSEMSSKEMDAIEECIDDLLPQDFQRREDVWCEADLVFGGEEEEDDHPAYGRLRCYTHNPSPLNGSLAESRIPHAIPESVLEALAGHTFRVVPRQHGLNAWGNLVEIRFESVA